MGVEKSKTDETSKLTNYQVAQILASRLVGIGVSPFKSGLNRFLVTIPVEEEASEVIELGPALKGNRFFRPNCTSKDIALVDEFSAFCKEVGLSDCYFWSICLPVRKAAFDQLDEELVRFNRKINNQFSELRKNHRFEQLVLAIHLRYDELTGAIDLHAHFICRVPPGNLEQVRHILNCAFSRPHLDIRSIRNHAATLNYMLYGIFNNREMVDWPDEALLAVWQLSQQKRYRYVRTGGAFAKWRRHAKLANDNVPKNKRPRPYPADPGKPRFLARVTAKIHGKQVAALLYEHPAEVAIRTTQEPRYSTASRRVTQETAMGAPPAVHSEATRFAIPAWDRFKTALFGIAAPILSWTEKIRQTGKWIARRLLC